MWKGIYNNTTITYGYHIILPETNEVSNSFLHRENDIRSKAVQTTRHEEQGHSLTLVSYSASPFTLCSVGNHDHMS